MDNLHTKLNCIINKNLKLTLYIKKLTYICDVSLIENGLESILILNKRYV